MPFSAARRLYVRSTCPSPSLSLSTLTSILSPTLATVVRSVGVLEYSLFVRIPSALYPMLRIISSSLTAITVPSTTSPLCLVVFKDSSSISSKLISAILVRTSSIILFGVEAPAVIPTQRKSLSFLISKSSGVCI